MTNFLQYPPTFKWAKRLTLSMFSEVPRGHTKESFALWFDLHLRSSALLLDAVWLIEML